MDPAATRPAAGPPPTGDDPVACASLASAGAPREDATAPDGPAISDSDAFRLLFDESPTPMIIQGPDFRALAANRAYYALTGRSPQTVIGHDPIDWTAPEDRGLIVEQRQRLSVGAHLPSSVTRRIVRPDGAIRVCRLRRHGAQGADGARIELVTLHDETDELLMQQRLRSYWQRFERFFEQAPVGLMIADAAGQVVQVNRALEQIVGRGRERLVGAPDSLVDPATADKARAGRARIAWTRDDGELRWLDRVDRDLEDLDGRPARLTVLHDVTRERTLRDELEETEARFRQFADLVDDAIFVVDFGLARVHYVNDRFEAVWGIASSAFVESPQRLYEPVRTEQVEGLRALFERSAGRGGEVLVALRHPALGPRSVRIRVFDERGAQVPGGPESPRLFAVAEDVTELLRLQQQRLDDALAQRDMLVREVHHRIKNNLQGVAGLLQHSASLRPELAAPLGEVAGRIHAIAQVHGLQVRDGETVTAARVVAAVFDNLSRTFGRSIPVTGLGDPDVERWRLPDQEAVPIALVVNELGTNAIKHGSGAGDVRVALCGDAHALVLEVANSGELPEGLDVTGRGAGPSGLGLIRALMPRRGARLSVQSRDGRVSVRVDLAPPVVAAAETAR